MDKHLPDFLIIPSVIITDKDLQPLDGLVYGVVYWYSRLKLEKCIASNEQIAKVVNVKNAGSIKNSLARLKKKGHVQVILDEYNHRVEILPLVRFGKDEAELLDTPSSNDATPVIKSDTLPSSNDAHNKNILIIKDNKNITNVIATPPKPTGIKSIVIHSSNGVQKTYGNIHINSVLKSFTQTFELPLMDGTDKQNRQYCYNLIRKLAPKTGNKDADFEAGVQMVLKVIAAANQSDYWRSKVTSMRTLYYHSIAIMQDSVKGQKKRMINAAELKEAIKRGEVTL